MESIYENMKPTLNILLILYLIISSFYNKICMENNGTPMGSPILVLLVEFILLPLEADIHSKFDYISNK